MLRTMVGGGEVDRDAAQGGTVATPGIDVELDDEAAIAALAKQLRVDTILATTRAGSGHPTSGLSSADLMAVLVARHLRYDWDHPDLASNDHLIFSKGHAAALLYAVYKAVGVISDQELSTTYRRAGTALHAHPRPALPWISVATGSLGQGLPVAVGMALAGRRLDKVAYHLWVLCGDGELAEGSMWEALDKASYYELSNLTAIVDVNGLGQRGETALGRDLDAYRRRVEAFGCRAMVVDGHDLAAIDRALGEARHDNHRPSVVLARTTTGQGVPEVAGRHDWHGQVLPPALAQLAMARLGGHRHLRVRTRMPAAAPAAGQASPPPIALPTYPIGSKVATARAYGEALRALGARADVVALDADVADSTWTRLFAAAHPERFFEMFVAEQQLVATAIGLGLRGYVAFASTLGAFMSRALDFIRMAAISGVDLRLVGCHAGVEVGQDGPSHMALEDLACLRAIPGSTVLYPADATAAAALVGIMADLPDVVYLRTTRGAYPVLYPPGEPFEVGGSKVHRGHRDDQVALLGAGVTVHACLAAADALQSIGVRTRVVDLYSVKPVDEDTVVRAARATQGRLVVVEDHYPEGGLGAAVLEALADCRQPARVVHLAVRSVPGSGSSTQLLEEARISAGYIARAAARLVGQESGA